MDAIKFIPIDISKLIVCGKDAVRLEVANKTFLRPDRARILKDFSENCNNSRPRTLSTNENLIRIKERLATDQVFQELYNNAESNAQKWLDTPVQTFVDRHVMIHIMGSLGIMYRLTGEEKYKKRATRELEAVLQLNELRNPKDILTFGYFLKGIGVGYDWFYDCLTAELKTKLEDFIEFVLKFAIESYHNPTAAFGTYNNPHWTIKSTNFVPSVNGGFLMCAVAVLGNERFNDIAAEVIRGALACYENFITVCYPDGAFREGCGYWHYATESVAEAFSTLDSAFGTTYGLAECPGMEKTCDFIAYMTGPCGVFNYGNSGGEVFLHHQLYYFADKYKLPYLEIIRRNNLSKMKGASISDYADLLWYKGLSDTANLNLPTTRYFRGIEAFSYRTSWKDDALCVICKGGDNQDVHGSLNCGTFIVDKGGERFAMQLGAENYGLPGYWDYREFGQRWKYYRMRAEGQNTLVINPDMMPDQNPLAKCAVEKYDENSVSINLTNAYRKNAKSVKRTFRIEQGKIIITDTVDLIETGDVYWFMHTNSEIVLEDNNRKAVLRKGGVTLTLKADDGYDFTVMDAKPMENTPNEAGINPNEGIKKLAVIVKGVNAAKINIEME